MKLRQLLGAIPLPRLRQPPSTPSTLMERVCANRLDPSTRWTSLNHIAANLSDMAHGAINGIGPNDSVYRDAENRFAGYLRKK